MSRAAAAALAALAVVPAQAAAQDAPPPPAPAAATVSVGLEKVKRDGRDRVVLAGERFRVRGTVTPFAAGQRVTVRLYRGPKKLRDQVVEVRQAGDRGTYAATLRAPKTGRLRVRALLGDVRSRTARLRSLRPAVRQGSRGASVRLLQAGLDRLGYFVSRSGAYDAATGRAVLAYRKVNGMARTTSASAAVARRVYRGRGAFKVRHPRAGRHLEADLSRQVLALIDGKRVVATYHTSSGTSATPTVRGAFAVYMKTPGTNAKGMVHSAYFIRGYAVHGYASVPTYPASHGCLRVPIPDARRIFDWLSMGDKVFVYG